MEAAFTGTPASTPVDASSAASPLVAQSAAASGADRSGIGDRSGVDLTKATRPFTDEQPARTWGLFAITFVVFWSFVAGAVALPWPLAVISSVLAGLTTVRLFIFYHDYLHGAVFRGSKLGHWVMVWVGMHTMNPPSVWRETHNYHHANNAKMTGAAIGSFPVVTTRIWRMMRPADRRKYVILRHPATMLFGYFTLFIAGMCLSAFFRDPRQHYSAVAALIWHFGLMALFGALFGLQGALLGVFLPCFVSCAAGAYLFYVQHNFPDIVLKDRRDWNYQFAALNSSSMFDMPAVMHWFTGNIGYHHVHHLNHKIPFYRLPEAMAAIPELQAPGRTSWHPRDIAAALRLKVWDPDQGRMVGYPK